MPDQDLASRLGALLFVATEPISLGRLAEATGSSEPDVDAALGALSSRLGAAGLGLSALDRHYRLVTAPAAASMVRKFLQDESNSDLTKPALETLAIVAYRGPITKSGVEAVRGVSSDTMLRNLIARGLITEAGKSAEPGRPVLYAISHTFLHHFGLAGPGDLPPVPEATDKQ